MKKEEAIRIIIKCAKQYKQSLEGKNLLFIFGSPSSPQSFEAVFLPRHFLHFTGVELKSDNLTSSTDFFNRCLNGNLRPNDIALPENGTVEMKLAVLPQMINIAKTAKMIGDYNHSKSLLYTEKLAGNVTACVGFVRDNRYYVPNTVLREDLRDISRRPQQRVLAVFEKNVSDPCYSLPTYIAKGLNLHTINLPKNIQGIIKYPVNEESKMIKQGDDVQNMGQKTPVPHAREENQSVQRKKEKPIRDIER